MTISLGDINFSLGADASALQHSLNRLRAFGREVERTSRSQADGAEKVAAAYRAQEAAVTSALQKTLNLNAAIRRSSDNTDLIERVNKAFGLYANQLTSTNVKTLTLQRANERLAASFNQVKRELGDIKKQQAEQNINRLTQALQAVSTATVLINSPLGGLVSRIAALRAIMNNTSITTGLMAAGFALATLGMYTLGKAVLQNSLKLDAAQSAFMAISGSVEESNRLMNEARGIANRAGQVYTTVAQQYARFAVAAQSTNLAGQESARIFETVSKVTGKLALPAEQARGVFHALEQMMSKGTIQAEELRGQLGDRLPGAFQIMARALGVSTIQLNEMLKKGQIFAEDALPKFRVELERTFNINETVNTFQASINRVSNSWTYLLDEIDRTFGVTQIATTALKLLSGALDSTKELIQEFSLGFRQIIAGLLQFANTVSDIANAVYEGFFGMFKRVGEMFEAFITDLKEFIEDPLNNGGFDKLAKAMDKEFVSAFTNAFDKVRAESKLFNESIQAEVAGAADVLLKRKAQEAGNPMGLGMSTGKQSGKNSEKKSKSGKSDPGALVAANLELERINAQIRALEQNGVPALEKLNGEFAKQDKIKHFADQLKRSGINAKEAAAKLEEYKTALNKFEIVDAAAKNTQGVIDELSQAGQRAFDRFGQAISDMVSKGKLNLNSLADVSKAIAADILHTFLQLTIMNPLKNMVFGGNSPVLGGFGGSSSGLLGAIGGSIGSLFGSQGGLARLTQTGSASFVDPLPAGGGGGGGLFSSLGSFFKFKKGGVSDSQGIIKMAKGGLLARPTMLNSISGDRILGGEAGTEAIVPLRRGSDGRLGVTMHGGGRSIVQHITIATPNPQAFKASEAQTAAMLRKAVAMGGRNS